MEFWQGMFFSYLLYHHKTLSFHIRRWSKSVNLALQVLLFFFFLMFWACTTSFLITLKTGFIVPLTRKYRMTYMETNGYSEHQNKVQKINDSQAKFQHVHIIISRMSKFSDGIFYYAFRSIKKLQAWPSSVDSRSFFLSLHSYSSLLK